MAAESRHSDEVLCLRPVERRLIDALREHEKNGRGRIEIIITPGEIDIQEGQRTRWRHGVRA